MADAETIRVLAVRTRSNGRAEFGHVTIPKSLLAGSEPKEVRKEPGAKSNPHFPPAGKTVFLTAREGKHKIYVAGNGVNEFSVEVLPGHSILFCDHDPGVDGRPSDNLRYSYAGHWSRADKEGATLQIVEIDGALDVDEYGWEALEVSTTSA